MASCITIMGITTPLLLRTDSPKMELSCKAACDMGAYFLSLQQFHSLRQFEPFLCPLHVVLSSCWKHEWISEYSWRKQSIKQGYFYLLENSPWKQIQVLVIVILVRYNSLFKNFLSFLPLSHLWSRTVFPDVCSVELVVCQMLVRARGFLYMQGWICHEAVKFKL